MRKEFEELLEIEKEFLFLMRLHKELNERLNDVIRRLRMQELE